MDDDAFPINSLPDENFPSIGMDLEYMDELLFEGCWLETKDGLDFSQLGASSSGALNDLNYLPPPETDDVCQDVSQHQQTCPQETGNSFSAELVGTSLGNYKALDAENSLFGMEPSRRWWIGPNGNLGFSSSVKERLMQAIGFMKDCTKDSNFLVQVWVPIKRRGKYVLTTSDQPYSFDPNCKSLANYRDVSTAYQFPAEEDSKDSAGLPGRVFLGKLPEWTPDVHFFRKEEYPRINYAQQYDVHGSLALPVFEQGSGTCLGVIEIVMTTQKTNYQPELDNVCKALEAVDLRSSHKLSPGVRVCSDLYQVVLPELVELLTSVCKAHRLPLALTWAPCIQQGKDGCRHSDENYAQCISTLHSAYFVADTEVLKFYEACSEHHMLLGQGIVGRAFTTNKPCFAADVTTLSKTEYPLSHHARMFNLRAALAVPLLSIHREAAEFVLEFFLPVDCQDTDEKRILVNSIFSVAQQASQGLHVVDKELEEIVVSSDGNINKHETQKSVSPPTKGSCPEGSSWITEMMKSQQKGKHVCVSLECPEEEPNEKLHEVTTEWDLSMVEICIPEVGKHQQNSEAQGRADIAVNPSTLGGVHSSGDRKSRDKRRTKTEKTISLQVLRQYFSGSLKDAAKSIGVCPTTLKRICRQYGINRWPSRKIKKVGHSLKKLQLVIDSVEGAEGAIQIDSFYSSFPELCSPNLSGCAPPFPTSKTGESPKKLDTQSASVLFSPVAPTVKSPSSSCSQSSGSSLCCSIAAKENISIIGSDDGDALIKDNPVGVLKRARSDAELLTPNAEETNTIARSKSHKSFGELPSVEILPPLPRTGQLIARDGGAFRIKANYGEEKVRFSMQPNSSFQDLQIEITKRFNIEDINRIDIKYLDDDHEWILLTCDDDLDECIDICRLYQIHTVKLSLHQASHPSLRSSFGSNGAY